MGPRWIRFTFYFYIYENCLQCSDINPISQTLSTFLETVSILATCYEIVLMRKYRRQIQELYLLFHQKLIPKLTAESMI